MSRSSDPTASFPKQSLTPIHGKPDFATLARLTQELTANAVSVHSNRGSGMHGHAAIVLGNDAYQEISAVAWVAPTNPGPEPNIPDNATQRAVTIGLSNFERQQKEWETYTLVANALKRQLLEAIEPVYLSSLSHPTFGFANVGVFQMLQHLRNTYAVLTPDILSKNLEALGAKWEPSESLEPLWERGVKARAIAQAGGDEITEETLVRVYRDVLKNTGLFALDIRDWDHKPQADKTLENFKAHFTIANMDRVTNLTVASTYSQQTARAYAAQSNSGSLPPLPSLDNRPPPGGPTILARNRGVETLLSYCWTHGATTNPAHTSRTCHAKAPGHQEDATIDNMKGGNDRIRRRPREKQVFKPAKKTRGSVTPPNDSASA